MDHIGITDRDLEAITAHGLASQQVAAMVGKLQSPPCYVPLTKPATRADGIHSLNDVEDLAEGFAALAIKPGKFTPMSGAASRMFGFLDRFLSRKGSEADVANVQDLVAGLVASKDAPRFPFVAELAAKLERDGLRLEELAEKRDHRTLVSYIMGEKGLAFAGKPKAVIPFHWRQGRAVTPLEEHMKEAMAYGGNALHITISPEHDSLFKEALTAIRADSPRLEAVEVTTSFQHPSTDSVALDAETGQIARDPAGQVAFFPAGHGSLIRNIGALGRPAILRNVDNIPKGERAQRLIEVFHKGLAVLLSRAKAEVKAGLSANDANRGDLGPLLQSIGELEALGFRLLLDRQRYGAAGPNEKVALARQALDRPIKVHGVVANEGEPGGGPFAIAYDGCEVVSIVEKDEVAPEQRHLLRDGRFFNPVDLLVDPTDYRGSPHDLEKFVNPSRHFIVRKPYHSKEVIRLEHPGLWNGAMDGWTSLFVMLPIETFAPVKEVNDLLRQQHQEN